MFDVAAARKGIGRLNYEATSRLQSLVGEATNRRLYRSPLAEEGMQSKLELAKVVHVLSNLERKRANSFIGSQESSREDDLIDAGVKMSRVCQELKVTSIPAILEMQFNPAFILEAWSMGLNNSHIGQINKFLADFLSINEEVRMVFHNGGGYSFYSTIDKERYVGKIRMYNGETSFDLHFNPHSARQIDSGPVGHAMRMVSKASVNADALEDYIIENMESLWPIKYFGPHILEIPRPDRFEFSIVLAKDEKRNSVLATSADFVFTTPNEPKIEMTLEFPANKITFVLHDEVVRAFSERLDTFRL